MDLFFYDVDANYIKYLISATDSALINASCDFKLLEEAARNYKPENQN